MLLEEMIIVSIAIQILITVILIVYIRPLIKLKTVKRIHEHSKNIILLNLFADTTKSRLIKAESRLTKAENDIHLLKYGTQMKIDDLNLQVPDPPEGDGDSENPPVKPPPKPPGHK